MTTIFAPLTNLSGSSIQVIRLSGPHITSVLLQLGVTKLLESRLAEYCILKIAGKPLDNAILTLFRAPHSFTGEDVLEISIHASPFISRALLTFLTSLPGLRYATNGEFSYRAFLNEKLDLTQSEAILKLVNSQTEAEHAIAIRELGGSLASMYYEMREQLLKAAALLEASIDFAEEEDVSTFTVAQIEQVIFVLKKQIYKILSVQFSKLESGINVVIVGHPNVGKSSIFNALLSAERAIVSNIPGTTRDVLSQSIVIDGFLVNLHDTAGLREATDEIEKIGIERAVKQAENADIILLLLEGKSETSQMIADYPDAIIVHTKSDLYGSRAGGINVSINAEDSITALKSVISKRIHEQFSAYTHAEHSCTARQKGLLEKSLNLFESLNFTMPVELIAEDIRCIATTLSEITSGINTDDILGEIFSKFCIGK